MVLGGWGRVGMKYTEGLGKEKDLRFLKWLGEMQRVLDNGLWHYTMTGVKVVISKDGKG